MLSVLDFKESKVFSYSFESKFKLPLIFSSSNSISGQVSFLFKEDQETEKEILKEVELSHQDFRDTTLK